MESLRKLAIRSETFLRVEKTSTGELAHGRSTHPREQDFFRSVLSVSIVCACFSLALVSCGHPVENKSLSLAEDICHPSYSPPEPDIQKVPQRLYIDASLSMAGYVRGSDGHTPFDKLLDQLAYAMPMSQVYRYGQRGTTPPKRVSDLFTYTTFGHELHNPNFYTLQDNPDDRLIGMLAGEGKPVLAVLITDGVYSAANGAASSVVVDAISRWMGLGRDLGILIFRSPYRGPFYSEQKRGMIGPVSTPDRPFYAFVFSPTTAAFEGLKSALKPQFPTMQAIFFSRRGVTCTVKMPTDAPGFVDLRSTPYHWLRFDSSLFGLTNQALLAYRLAYTIAPDYPAAGINLDVATSYYRWRGNGFSRVQSGMPPSPDCSITTGKIAGANGSLSRAVECTFEATPNLARDPASRYSFYAFKFHATVSSLRDEIQQLSTMDDSLPKNADKTYRFYQLITAITNMQFNMQLASQNSPCLMMTVANTR